MTGYVYAIRAAKVCLVKIGWSENPPKRVRQIRNHSPIDVVLVGFTEATRDQEIEAHTLLREYRVRGEWFQDLGAVAAFSEMLKPHVDIHVDGDSAYIVMDAIIARLKNEIGATELAKRLSELGSSITSQAISQWNRVPAERALDVERVTGVSRQDLRPDLWPREDIEAHDSAGVSQSRTEAAE